jgi:hypothetical protein
MNEGNPGFDPNAGTNRIAVVPTTATEGNGVSPEGNGVSPVELTFEAGF